MDVKYQEIHGAFMKNQTGSSLVDIHSVLVIPICIFVLKILLLLSLPHFPHIHHGTVRFLIEFLLVVSTQLAAVTCMNRRSREIGAVVIVVTSVVFVLAAVKYVRTRNTTRIEKLFHQTETFMTTFRSGMLVLTVMCILAVDFDVFPRRFAKTEVYGTSLMDMGVGLFVITNAIVSSEARRSKPQNNIRRLRGAILSSLPLLVLGFGRLVVIKALSYHENTSEYGTHWNFFFTLAVAKIGSALIFCVVHPRRATYLAMFLIVSYQIWLTAFHQSSYVIDGKVDSAVGNSGFLYENRGGIFSCIGFLALYFVGVGMGRSVFANQRLKLHHVFKLILHLLIASFGSFLLLLFVSIYVEPVSRRLANFGYFLSVASISCFDLALLVSLDLSVAVFTFNRSNIKKAETTYFGSVLLCAVNSNALAVFLLANVTTGLVNLSVKTIYASSSISMQILVTYMLFVISVAYFLKSRQISTKKW